MVEIRVCPSCGIEVPADAAFCPREGTALGEAFEPTAVKDPLIGTYVGEYQIKRRLGEGGMGLVYQGLQPVIGKGVAIKVLLPEIARDPEWSARFVSEARAVNAIRHRGIVDVFSFATLVDGRQCMVMELLEGDALDHLINKKGRLEVLESLPLLEDALDALDAAHGAGVIHRDLKPSNIFVVRPTRGAPYVKLLDFGLAKQGLPDGSATPQTRVSRVVGTPHYMAPEQACGQPVSPPTDLYAMGVVIFEMLSGRLPFDAPAPLEVLQHHLNSTPPRLAEIVPGIPPALDELVARLLLKEPAARPASAAAVRKELSRLRRTLEPRTTQVPASFSAPIASSTADPCAPTVQVRVAGAGERQARATTERIEPPASRRTQREASNRLPLALGLGALVTAGAIGVAVFAIRPAPAGVPEPSPPIAAASPRVGGPSGDAAPAATPTPSPSPPPTPEPKAAPKPAPQRVAAPEPKRPVKTASDADTTLRARFARLEQRAKAPGSGTSRSALVLLDKAGKDLAAARSAEDYAKVADFLDSWERRYLRPTPPE